MKKIIESQIFVLSKTNKISATIQICYTDDEVEISINYNGTEYLRSKCIISPQAMHHLTNDRNYDKIRVIEGVLERKQTCRTFNGLFS